MGVVIVEGEGAVLEVNLGRPIVTNGTLRRGSSQITLGRTLLVLLETARKAGQQLPMYLMDGGGDPSSLQARRSCAVSS